MARLAADLHDVGRAVAGRKLDHAEPVADAARGPSSRYRSRPRRVVRRGPADRRDAGGWSLRPCVRRICESGQLVPRRGLEPPRLSPLVPETSASTNSATWAQVRSGADIRAGVPPCQSWRRPAGGRPTIAIHRQASDRALETASRRRYTGRQRCFAAKARPMTANPHRHAGHGLRRLGLPRPPCGAGAGAARLPHPRRGAPPRPRRPSAAARPRRPDPRRAGQPALRRARSRPRSRGADVVDQPRRHPVRARPPAFRRRAALRRRAGRARRRGRTARAWSMSRRSAPTRTRPSLYARTKARGRAARAAARRRTPSILRPSIVFGPEDDFFNRFAALARMSPALPLIGGGRHASSRCSSATSPRRSPMRSTARRKARHDL